jgi:cytoskeletal protein CcmA (bactofilin family)
MFHRSTAQPQNNKLMNTQNQAQTQVQNSAQGFAPDQVVADTATPHNATDKYQQKFQAQPQRKIYRPRVESSAVQKYATSQNASAEHAQHQLNYQANQNGQSHTINSMLDVDTIDVDKGNKNLKPTTSNPIENEKEINAMNTPEPQIKKNAPDADKVASPQNRDVNIPGNNFQRPGAPAPVPGRPAYPGSYGAAAPANAPYGAPGMDSGSKLVIGEGITMSGEIESCEHLIVQGTIEAVLKGASLLDVSQTGAFLGTVEIDEANIAGRFEGDITVKGRLTIESTGEVVGSISYKELSMEAGAVIDGSISPIGSTNAAARAANNKKTPSLKSKKASINSGAELPFSDGSKPDAAQS